jgi:hypothetical protein
LKTFPQQQPIGEKQFSGLLDKYLPCLGPQQRNRILDAAAVAAYHAQMEFPIIRLLLCDDAPQFKLITRELSLCWVHDGRHYKRLVPFIPRHQQLLETFLKQYWDFYRQLLQYREYPSDKEHIRLDNLFDKVFSTVTGYDALDQRIAKTKAKNSLCYWYSITLRFHSITTLQNWGHESGFVNESSVLVPAPLMAPWPGPCRGVRRRFPHKRGDLFYDFARVICAGKVFGNHTQQHCLVPRAASYQYYSRSRIFIARKAPLILFNIESCFGAANSRSAVTKKR